MARMYNLKLEFRTTNFYLGVSKGFIIANLQRVKNSQDKQLGTIRVYSNVRYISTISTISGKLTRVQTTKIVSPFQYDNHTYNISSWISLPINVSQITSQEEITHLKHMAYPWLVSTSVERFVWRKMIEAWTKNVQQHGRKWPRPNFMYYLRMCDEGLRNVWRTSVKDAVPKPGFERENCRIRSMSVTHWTVTSDGASLQGLTRQAKYV